MELQTFEDFPVGRVVGAQGGTGPGHRPLTAGERAGSGVHLAGQIRTHPAARSVDHVLGAADLLRRLHGPIMPGPARLLQAESLPAAGLS